MPSSKRKPKDAPSSKQPAFSNPTGLSHKDLPGKLLASPDFRVRAYAARLLATPEKAISDPHPRVRTEAIVALSRQPSAESLTIILKALDSPRDPFLDYALENSTRALATFSGKLSNLPENHRAYLEKITSAPTSAPHPGKIVYDGLCLNCHQPGGSGLPGVYPPLADTDWVRGDPDRAIKILLHGLTGPIEVAGKTYGENPPLPMPPMGLDDSQIADVLSYLRTEEFKNTANPVTADQVKKVREAQGARATPWTAEELTE